MGVYLFAFLFFFMALGVPIAFAMAMGLAATIHVWGGISFSMLFQQIFQGINSFTFIAVPMFILAGELMSRVGIIDDILLLCRVVMGWVPGSLANANIVASMFFAGVSGSAVADTSAIGGALIPAMVKEGYDDDFSVAVTASSSVIGPIIPPSIGMVLYGATLGTSISAMFMGGLIPGILLGLGLMIPATYLSIKRKYPRNTEKYTPKQITHAFVRAIPALLMPVIILGGILGGVCSPTEAASVAILYSIIVGVFYYRSLNLKILVDCMVKAMIQSGAVLLIAAPDQHLPADPGLRHRRKCEPFDFRSDFGTAGCVPGSPPHPFCNHLYFKYHHRPGHAALRRMPVHRKQYCQNTAVPYHEGGDPVLPGGDRGAAADHLRARDRAGGAEDAGADIRNTKFYREERKMLCH